MLTDIRQRAKRKQDVRYDIQSEYIDKTKGGTLFLAGLNTLQWAYGIFINPSDIKKDVTIGLLSLSAIVLLAISHSPNFSPFRSACLSYAVVSALLFSSTVLCGLLHGGTFLIGFFAIYFLVATLYLCKQYPFNANLAGCVLLGLGPHLYGHPLIEHFDHVVYAVLVYPALALVLFAHHDIRQKIVISHVLARPRRYHGDKRKRQDIYGVKQFYSQVMEHAKAAESKHSLLRISINDRCRTGDPLSHDEQRQQRILAALQHALRNDDCSALISKLDFICILVDTDKDIAAIIAERVQDKIHEELYSLDRGNALFKMHIGIFQLDPAESFEALLARTAYKPKKKRASPKG